MKWILLCASFGFFVTSTQAGTPFLDGLSPSMEVLKSNRFTMYTNPKDCGKNQTCTLNTVDFYSVDYRVWVIDRYHHGSALYAFYDTKDLANIEDYVFVQYVKGCVYNDMRFTNGRPHEVVLGYKEQFDQTVRFHFPNWVIDTVDLDPVYQSNTKESDFRHYAYRWNEKVRSIDRKTEHFLLREQPLKPEIYVNDLPSQGYYDEEYYPSAYNVSMDFKTCLYRKSDVPERVKSPGTWIENPIVCYEWSNRHTYDYGKKEFTNPASIDPICK